MNREPVAKKITPEMLHRVWARAPKSHSLPKTKDALLKYAQRCGFLSVQEVASIRKEAPDSLVAAGEYLRSFNNEEAPIIALGFFWVAASLGDQHACNQVISALEEEKASDHSVHDRSTLERLLRQWTGFRDELALRATAQRQPSSIDFDMHGSDPVLIVQHFDQSQHYYPTRGDALPADLELAIDTRELDSGKATSARDLRRRVAQKKILRWLEERQQKFHRHHFSQEGTRFSDDQIRKLIDANLEDDTSEDEPPTASTASPEALWPDRQTEKDSHSKAAADERPPVVVVCTAIGDAQSREGGEIAQRYQAIIDSPLPCHGKLSNVSQLLNEFRETFPWAGNFVRFIGGQLHLLQRSGNTVLTLPPLLLVGPPGSGKTRMLEWLSEKLETRWQTIACGGVTDSGGLGAVTRGWASSRASAPVQAMVDLNCANPVLLLDELDKATEPGSRNGSVMAILISMLQSSGAYYDPCLMAPVDISHVSFLATANDTSRLPDALSDRFMIFEVPRPGAEHFDGLLKGVHRNEARRLGMREELLPWLTLDDITWLKRAFCESGFSIRALEQAHRVMIGEKATEEAEKYRLLN